MDEIRHTHTPEHASEEDDNWTPDRSEVERLAYYYHEQSGFTHGSHDDDWHRAERELRRRHQQERANASSDKSPSTATSSETSNTAQRTVVGVFNSVDEAQRAVEALHREGLSNDDISFIANQNGSAEVSDGGKGAGTAAEERSEIATEAGIGAAAGGVGGLLLSFAGIAIPGIGPVLAAGPLIAALAGAGVGAAAGGLIGALSERGVPSDAAAHYAEGVRRGDVLVTVQTSGERASRVSEILDQNGAVDIDDRVSDWRKRGWNGPEDQSAPLSEDELRREREYYSAAREQAQEWSRRGDPTAREVRRASRIY